MWSFASALRMNHRELKQNCPRSSLAYAMGFWSLIALLVLSSGSAYGEWAAVERDYLSPGLQTVYVDSDTIRKEGNLVTLWQLVDFKWMQGSARGPARFMSTKTHKQFDCAGKRVRLLAFTEYSHPMGTGIPVNGHIDSDWLSVEPDSMNRALWEVACGTKGSTIRSVTRHLAVWWSPNAGQAPSAVSRFIGADPSVIVTIG
jgi:hypothetical protein